MALPAGIFPFDDCMLADIVNLINQDLLLVQGICLGKGYPRPKLVVSLWCTGLISAHGVGRLVDRTNN